MKKLLIRGGSLVKPEGLVQFDILIAATGEIEEIKPSIQLRKEFELMDAEGLLLFPLLIDCHVHFREPGLEHKGTMETEAASALAGGIGTVCEMPNTIPPTVTTEALADKVKRGSHVHGVDIRFFFGITESAHLEALRELWGGTSVEAKRLKRHCCGVKLYLDHSTGDQKVDGRILDAIFTTCTELKIPIVAHCEDAQMNEVASGQWRVASDVSQHSKRRPPESEEKSIKDALALVRKHGTQFHIAHLSTKQGIDLVRKAKKEKLPVTCEVAPHHLFLTVDDYVTLGSRAKMNPPLRTQEHQDALWEGIADGTVDCISTDHAPHTLAEKMSASPPSGVPGVETMLPLLLTVASGRWPHPNSNLKPQTSKLSYPDILRLCFTNPNRIFSLNTASIEPKKKARIAIVDPAAEWTISAEHLHAKCGWTPYEGWKVMGTVSKRYEV